METRANRHDPTSSVESQRIRKRQNSLMPFDENHLDSRFTYTHHGAKRHELK